MKLLHWLFGPPSADRRRRATWSSEAARLRAAIAADQDPLRGPGAAGRAPLGERAAFWRAAEEEAFRYLVVEA